MEHSFKGPGFRWQLADKHRTLSQKDKFWTWLDKPTQQAIKYLREMRRESHGPDRAKDRFTVVTAAIELLQNEKALESLKLAILGDLPRVEISERTNIDQAVLETTELLFFDIRGKREATSWMTCHVFMPAMKGGDMDLAAKMKIAFFGGPVMARAMLDARDHLPIDDAKRLVDQEVLLHGKLQAALEFRLSEATAPQFLKTFLNYDLARQKLEFAREKFQHKCEVAQRQHEAELRSEQRHDDDQENWLPPVPHAEATESNEKVNDEAKRVA
ncbi:MAG: hypothetical protein CMJ84_11800 [Planctomycetes bacterium]|nr:hypothetical protein [Planctomycetota bacterium]